MTDKIFEGLVLALGIGSLGMMVYGLVHQDFWFGFGLIMATPSVLAWYSIFRGARRPAGSVLNRSH